MKLKNKIAAISAVVAAACSMVPVMQASAWYCWGTASSDEYSEMTVVDDKGLLKWTTWNGAEYSDYQVAVQHSEADRENPETGETVHDAWDTLYILKPRKNVFRFTLREDAENAEQKMLDILEPYYSGITEMYHSYKEGNNFYGVEAAKGKKLTFMIHDAKPHEIEVYDYTENAGSRQMTGSILRELAQADLISAFYDWGQTANYQEADFRYRDIPLTYGAFSYENYKNQDFETPAPRCDLAALQAYVREHQLDCAVREVTFEDSYFVIDDKQIPDIYYQIVPNTAMSLAEQFSIAADIYSLYGYVPLLEIPETASGESAIGQNALRQAGDLNLDCAVTVADAVMLARIAAEDKSVQITANGLANADINGDSKTDTEDVTALLKQLAGIL